MMGRQMVRVKITQCKHRHAWYRFHVGKTFLVYEFGSDYVLKEDCDRGNEAIWRHIDKGDCEEWHEQEAT